MKKQIISSISILSVMLLGCGGGGASSAPIVDVAKLIENQPFYRVKRSTSRYSKETFDGNGTLHKEIYFMDSSLDENTTISYRISGTRVYMTENNVTVHCRVEDHNASVTFLCLKEGFSGSGTPTIRWKTLTDAKIHPES